MLRNLLKGTRNEKGTALAYAIGFVLICSMLMAGGSSLILSSLKGGSIHLSRSQVENVARAGFRDTYMWFRRQESQPVGVFDPDGGDSEDPDIGLVNSFPISSAEGLWGRYEVSRSAVNDITAKRGRDGKGLVWQVKSVGYVYRLIDPDKEFGESPNKIIARTTMTGEIQRTTITLPASAILSYNGNQIGIGKKAEVKGGAEGTGVAGVTYKANTGNPNIKGPVEGDPPTGKHKNLDLEVETVFGVSKAELKTMAEYVVGSVSELPTPMPEMALMYIDGNASFTQENPLSGGGLLFVDGNMSIPANTGGDFFGLIYVTGQFSGSSNLDIVGALVVRGAMVITGGPSKTIVEYNAEVLENVRLTLSQYRESKTVHVEARD
ncbi:MAG: hypothetical protein ACE5JA_05150 [bacterium]